MHHRDNSKHPAPDKRLAAACLAAALLAHLAPLLLFHALDPVPPPPPAMRDWTNFEIRLTGTEGLGGDGLPDGVQADKGAIASPLPRNPDAGAARPTAKPAKDKSGVSPRPSARPAAPINIQAAGRPHPSGKRKPAETRPRAEKAPQPARTALPNADASAGRAGHGPGSGPGHAMGIPLGSGGFGSGTRGVGIGLADRRARVVKRVPPAYPARARRRGITGRVVVRFVVDETGRPRNATVIEARPEGLFEKNALDAVKKWRFEPAIIQGRPAPMPMMLPVSFTLNNNAKAF